jgi:curved DNA-binding protein CbpA
MGSKPKSIKEYCEILGVSPNASPDEIRLAFVLLKRESQTSGSPPLRDLQEAYQRLTEPNRKDVSARAPQRTGPGADTLSRSSVSALLILAGAFAALVVVLALYVYPMYGYRLKHFGPDSMLLEARTGRPFGTILEVQAAHAFPNGSVGPAYRLRLEPDGRESWLPQNDVHYLCQQR